MSKCRTGLCGARRIERWGPAPRREPPGRSWCPESHLRVAGPVHSWNEASRGTAPLVMPHLSGPVTERVRLVRGRGARSTPVEPAARRGASATAHERASGELRPLVGPQQEAVAVPADVVTSISGRMRRGRRASGSAPRERDSTGSGCATTGPLPPRRRAGRARLGNRAYSTSCVPEGLSRIPS